MKWNGMELNGIASGRVAESQAAEWRNRKRQSGGIFKKNSYILKKNIGYYYNKNIMVNFVLTGLNQTFTLGVSGEIAGAAPPTLDVSCVAIYNVKLSDMKNVFKFQSDSFDVNNVDGSDIQYYVYMNAWPADLSLNPANAHTLSSSPILADSADVVAKRNFVKHDFVRYLALRLFNTAYGVDLFSNESELLSDLVTKGATAAGDIITALKAVDQASAANGNAPNKYSTNALTGATNFTRELMQQLANTQAGRARFAGMENSSGIQSVPLEADDTISFKVSINAAPNQHDLTQRPDAFETRTYKIELHLKASPTQVVPDEADSAAQYPYHNV